MAPFKFSSQPNECTVCTASATKQNKRRRIQFKGKATSEREFTTRENKALQKFVKNAQVRFI